MKERICGYLPERAFFSRMPDHVTPLDWCGSVTRQHAMRRLFRVPVTLVNVCHSFIACASRSSGKKGRLTPQQRVHQNLQY